ncbi:MAG TPA: quinolinate synthase NadA [Victivallales bacterium]|nr:quinolinate synthase NadA [Victivallales bacterium]HPO90340.1 quinolinate synthase NadA [Victivallales bacterium]HRR29439.1 quinolinate synthase NadA [Victivallales bacterium]
MESLKESINKLRKEKDALILAHNYQLGEIQDIADFTGDSLELSFKAAQCKKELIVFCGVTFMAETASILANDKIVLLPVLEAGCPMADMADVGKLRKLKAEHPNAIVVTYVNSSAEVKAESDICVTSANAIKIISSLPLDREIIFVPDQNLGNYCSKKTGRKIILWNGFCPTHMRISPEYIIKRKEEFPDAKVIVHPECPIDVIALADEVLSTGGMIKYAKTTDAKKIIVATELGLIYRLEKENPEKQFIPVSEQAVCPNMKLTRLEDVLDALKNLKYPVKVPSEIAKKARVPIEKMLEMSSTQNK